MSELTEIEELIWSNSEEDRWDALSRKNLDTEHLEILATDPVVKLAEEATERLKEKEDVSPLKVYFEVFPESEVSVTSDSILNADFRIMFFQGQWPFRFRFPVQNEIYPGTFSVGYAEPLEYKFRFPEDSVYYCYSPDLAVQGEMEILDVLDGEYRK